MKNANLIFDLLDIPGPVPLTNKEMARYLNVTFYSPHQQTEKLDQFSGALKQALTDSGVNVLPFEEALDKNNEYRIKPGIVTIEQGEGRDEELAIRRVSSLYHNPIVTILEGPPPIPPQPTLQEILDSIVGVLAWNLTHVPIFVEDHRWSFCTMNGAVIECNNWEHPHNDVIDSLIPKLAAQVVPPSRDDIVYREHIFDPVKEGHESHIRDFMDAAKIWKQNGLMLAHTSIEDLNYRNTFYKRIVSAYLDHRTGMSYGFLVKQLPTEVKPAIELQKAENGYQRISSERPYLYHNNGQYYVNVSFADKEYLVYLPEVWLLSTRSGCNKTDLKPDRDILKLGLYNGRITIDTPVKLSAKMCRPSYDTYAILAHAIGNVIAASLLENLSPGSIFSKTLKNKGLSISHWHGYPDHHFPLQGYLRHGSTNPPVSCSTPQSASYAFTVKLNTLEQHLSEFDLRQYRGDIHVEPHHGTNITGCMNLSETAEWVDKMHSNSLPFGEATHAQQVESE